jgi:hypothetical protein
VHELHSDFVSLIGEIIFKLADPFDIMTSGKINFHTTFEIMLFCYLQNLGLQWFNFQSLSLALFSTEVLQ